MANVATSVSHSRKRALKPDTTTIKLAIVAILIVVLSVGYLVMLKPIAKTNSAFEQQESVQQLSEPVVPGAGVPATQQNKADDDDNY